MYKVYPIVRGHHDSVVPKVVCWIYLHTANVCYFFGTIVQIGFHK